MKFIRNSRTRERVVDVLTKGALIALSALVCLWMVSGARAAGTAGITSIKQEQLADGSWAVDFLLAKPVAKEDVAVDFQRNFIQLSLKGVTAYPARTEKLKHPDLEKVFTYQYQPDLARARVLVKGQASSIKNRSAWEVTDRGIRITVGANPNTAATEDSVKGVAAAPIKSADKEALVNVDAEEAARAEILNESAAASKAKSEGVKAESTASAKTAKPADPESLPLFANSGGQAPVAEKSRELPVSKMLGSLLLVVLMIGAAAMGFRKFALGKGSPFVRQPKMIEVISSQAMGPKRSIAVVKVLDQYMVVGMSGDGMNLLTNLGADVNIDRFIDAAGPGGSFTDVFQGAISSSDAPPSSAAQTAAPKGDPGVRNSIKKRLEGFKPLRGN